MAMREGGLKLSLVSCSTADLYSSRATNWPLIFHLRGHEPSIRLLQQVSHATVLRMVLCQSQRLLDGTHLSSSFRTKVPCVARPVRLTMPVGCTMTCSQPTYCYT